MDATNRWQSKIEGVLDAGLGMMAYVAPSFVGGGANLVCTVLMLALFCHIRSGRRLGQVSSVPAACTIAPLHHCATIAPFTIDQHPPTKCISLQVLHLQLDNTTAENKNNTVIGLLALLVAWGKFSTVTIFFLHVGHTHNDLDGTFSPLIAEMLGIALATVKARISSTRALHSPPATYARMCVHVHSCCMCSSLCQALLDYLERKLAIQRIREVRLLPHIWDFSKWLGPHLSGLKGFATNQEGSGMHEMLLYKDAEGRVRFNAKQTSQASHWMFGACVSQPLHG